jgi:hypothetical protein
MSQNEGLSAPKKTADEAENGIGQHDGAAPAGNVHDAKLSGNDTGICSHCGHALKGSGLEQFLDRLGISEEMLNKLKGQLQNADVEEYLNSAREYLDGSGKDVPFYVKENPAKVAVGVAALALGAGLVWSSFAHRTDTAELEDRVRQLELRLALAGPRHGLDEVLSELGIAV